MAIHDALLDAVHVQVLLVDTLMLPVPAGASTLALPGEIEYEQTSADCVTVSV